MKKLLLIITVFCFSTSVWADTIVKDTIMCTTNNGCITEVYKSTTLIKTAWNMEVKTATGFTRWGYVEIPLDKLNLNATKIEFKIYLTGEKLATKNADQTLNTSTYTSDDLANKGLKLSLYFLNYSFDSNVSWDLRTIPTLENEVSVGDISVDNTNKDTYLIWDVTDLVKAKKMANETHLRIRLATKDATQLLRLRQINTTATGVVQTGSYYPRLVQERSVTGMSEVNTDKSIVFPTVATNRIIVTDGIRVTIYDTQGKIVLTQQIENKTLNISSLKSGIYLLKTESGICRFIKK